MFYCLFQDTLAWLTVKTNANDLIYRIHNPAFIYWSPSLVSCETLLNLNNADLISTFASRNQICSLEGSRKCLILNASFYLECRSKNMDFL